MGSKMHLDFERLDLTNKPFLEKSMELLMDGIENLRNVRPAASLPRAPPPPRPAPPARRPRMLLTGPCKLIFGNDGH